MRTEVTDTQRAVPSLRKVFSHISSLLEMFGKKTGFGISQMESESPFGHSGVHDFSK